MITNQEKLNWNNSILIGFVSILLARLVSVLFVFQSIHLCKRDAKRAVSLRQQILIVFCGVRGALAFALAVTVPEYDSVTEVGSFHAGEILSSTVGCLGCGFDY